MSAGSLLRLGLAGIVIATVGAIGVSGGTEPHLSLSALDPWLVIFALGVLLALGAAPYAIFDRHAHIEDEGERWDWALTVWGGCALVAGLGFVAVGLLGSFDPATASGAIAVVGAGACALVFGTLVLFVLFGD